MLSRERGSAGNYITRILLLGVKSGSPCNNQFEENCVGVIPADMFFSPRFDAINLNVKGELGTLILQGQKDDMV